MVKVSVIVPVYNVEKYLPSCLDSLVQQTLQDIEVIVVNDGSPDNSQQIIDEYTLRYPNLIKAFIQENGGVAKARNLALQHASGEYLMFLDSDDKLTEDACEKMFNKAKETNADIVAARSCWQYEDGKRKPVMYLEHWYNQPQKNYREDQGFGIYFPIVTAKLFKRELFVQNLLQFPMGISSGEDVIVACKTWYYAKEIRIIPEIVYLRTERSDVENPSATQQATYRIVNDRIKVVKILSEFCIQKGLKYLEIIVVFSQMCFIDKIIPKIQNSIEKQQAVDLLHQYKKEKGTLIWFVYQMKESAVKWKAIKLLSMLRR